MSEPMYPAPPPPGGPPPTAPPPAGPPPTAPPPAARPGLPWENAKDLGSLVETTKLLITSPAQAYGMAKEKGDYASPILFAIVFGIFGAILGGLWNLIIGPKYYAFLLKLMPAEVRDQVAARMMSGGTNAAGLVVGIILTPIIFVIALFIGSAIVHLVLNLLGGTKESTAGFEGTFRVLSYAMVTELATILPLAGGLIGWIWALVLGTLGLSSLHRTSQGKALGAMLIPIAVCCCLVIVGVTMLAGAIGAVIGGMNQ